MITVSLPPKLGAADDDGIAQAGISEPKLSPLLRRGPKEGTPRKEQEHNNTLKVQVGIFLSCSYYILGMAHDFHRT